MDLALPLSSVVGFLLALVRTSAWMLVSPPFNTRLMPRLVKIGTAAAISLAVAPNLPAEQMTLETGPLLGMVLIQAVTGVVLGYLTLILFSAIQAAGSLIDLFGGFSMAQTMDPFSNNQTSIFGRFYQLLATTLLFTVNGHLLLIKGFATSFEAVPLGGIAVEQFQTLVLRNLSMFVLAGVEIAGPLLAAYFLADVALGLLSKAAPQLNIFTFGFPFKILLTLLLVASAMPLIPGALETLVETAVRDGVRALAIGQ